MTDRTDNTDLRSRPGELPAKAQEYRTFLDHASGLASFYGKDPEGWYARFAVALRGLGLTLSATPAHGDAYPQGVAMQAPYAPSGQQPQWPAVLYVVWTADAPVDNVDLNCLLADATAAAQGDSQVSHMPLEPAKHGMTFREGYRYSPAPGGGYIGYPEDSQPEIIQKADGPMLRCQDGTAHFLTLWERLGLRAGFITLDQLNDKYRLQDCQA